MPRAKVVMVLHNPCLGQRLSCVWLVTYKPTNGWMQDANPQSGYLAHSSEDNKVMHIVPLTTDFTGVRDIYNRVFVNQSREAPAMFKYKDMYLMATSGCTGWEANRLVVYWTR